jgi:hypothetical protein
MERLRIYIPPETYVLPRVADQRVRGRALQWPSFVDLTLASFEYHAEFNTFNIDNLRNYAIKAKKWSRDKQNLESLILGLYSHLALNEKFQFDWLGDKTPVNTLHMGRLSRVMKGARYIFLLRDGVDVSVSYVNSGIYNNLTEAAERWVRSQNSWETFRRTLPEEQYLEVRYENLVTFPEENIDRISEHFGIPHRKGEESVWRLMGDVTVHGHHHNVAGAPNTESIGKGRRSLTDNGAKELRAVLSGWLEYWGYSRV